MHRDFIMPPSAPGLNEMGMNPLTLSFPRNIERSFLKYYYLNSLIVVRLSLFAGVLLYGLFGILDAELVPKLKEHLWLIRFGIVWPFLLGVIFLSFFRIFQKIFQLSIMLAMIIACFAIIYMISIMPPPANHYYYAGLILVFIWGYTFTRLRFVWATTAGWIVVAFYEIVAKWVIDTPTLIFISNNFFFMSANLVGMFACYSIEYYTRRDYFFARKLEDERGKVNVANQKLEKIIQERTAQLTQTNKNLRQEIEERKVAEAKKIELEKKLQYAQRMEALGTLAGGIAHDFNNLLMGIQGNASLMSLSIDPSDSNYERIKNTEQYVLRGSELTRQLLGFAQGGKYEVKATNINTLIEKSLQMFGRTKKELEIKTNFNNDLWTVIVDRGQIDQVLLNLYVNAWQAMPDGGELVLTTDNFIIDVNHLKTLELKLGKYVKISVKDTGIGIDKKIQKKIFDPFFTTKEKAGNRGTGLGLASAYGIIANHDGFIDVSSEIGKGSEFCIYLPAFEDNITDKENLSHKMLPGSETILLVDDEDMIIDVVSSMLKQLGYQVLTAKRGEDAIEIYKKDWQKIHMIILDLIMPGIGGRRTYDVLKEINPNVKVLLSSGYSASETNVTLGKGCDGFIQKPFDISQVSVKIRDIMSLTTQ